MLLKKTFKTWTLLLFLAASPLIADNDDYINVSDMGSEKIEEEAPKKSSSPFYFSAKIDAIRKAEIREGFFKKDHIEFREAELELGAFFYYCPKYTEAASASVSYTSTLIKWDGNPWFEQHHFHAATFSLSGITKRLDDWTWRGEVGISMDANEWDFNDYTWYDLLVWGRYDYNKCVGVHIGFIVETGMQLDRVYPILGFDWKISDKWNLSVVYPVNISLTYTINKKWSLALAERNFNSRYRIGKHEALAQHVLRYTNVGFEFAANYEVKNTTANLHVGYATGGLLKLANRNNHHTHHYRLDPAPYVGGEVKVTF